MNNLDYRRLRELFHAACDLPAERRDGFVQEECGDDDALRRELESLLEHDDDDALISRLDGESIDSSAPSQEPPFTRSMHSSSTADTPSSIGSYRILSLIAHGGMGTVYEAEQDSPRRRIALKVIRPGLASPTTLRRFEQEAQLLGLLQHPGIAQVYEAGTSEAAGGTQPFFAMELIRGHSILKYARENQLSVDARLKLFIRVCDAVHHAHTKGIIHRDLKPDNILVVEDHDPAGQSASPPTGPASAPMPQPKILDFGVARVTDVDLKTTTMRTDVGQLIGTVPYMSPEQARGNSDDIDTRSDVYALGVLAFELLTGELPYDIRNTMIHESIRVIIEEEPTRMSNFGRRFRGDVETIVSKALEKDKERRYDSAAALAQDIQRHLNDEPIEGRPPTARYQIGKFARRHKPFVAGIAAAFVLSIAATIGTSYGMTQANNQRMSSEAFRSFLVAMISAVGPDDLGRDVLVRDVLVRAMTSVEVEFADRPLLAMEMYTILGDAFDKLGEFGYAKTCFSRAVDLVEPELGSDSIESIENRRSLANMHIKLKELDTAVDVANGAYATAMDSLGAKHEATHYCATILASAYLNLGKTALAETLLESTLSNIGSTAKHSSPAHRQTLTLLGLLRTMQGRFDDAIDVQRRAIEMASAESGPTSEEARFMRTELAATYWKASRLREAESELRELSDLYATVHGMDHRRTTVALNNLGLVLFDQRELVEAEKVLRDVYERRVVSLDADHMDLITSKNNLGLVLANLGRSDEAMPLYIDVHESLIRTVGAEHPHTLMTLHNLGSESYRQKDYEKSIEYLQDAHDSRERILGPSHSDTLTTKVFLGRSTWHLGDDQKGEELCLEAIGRAREAYGDQSPFTARFLHHYGLLLKHASRLSEAASVLAEAVDAMTVSLGEDHKKTKDAATALQEVEDLLQSIESN